MSRQSGRQPTRLIAPSLLVALVHASQFTTVRLALMLAMMKDKEESECDGEDDDNDVN